MPENVRLFRVLLAAPSDVTQELDIVIELLREWNLHHGERLSTRLEFMNWRSHSYPATGARPQAVINRQFADRADVVVAVFYKRFGSPTGKAGSGTEEEIDRAMRLRKKVMVYFCERPSTDRRPGEPEQLAKLEEFRERFGMKALYGLYSDVLNFERTFRKDLALAMNDLALQEKG
jgi:hypothetical protein